MVRTTAVRPKRAADPSGEELAARLRFALTRLNPRLRQARLAGVPPAPRGEAQIEVAFAIDSNGIVNVSARDMATNQTQGIDINPAGGLSKEEVDRVVDEARAFAADDATRREVRRLKNRLEGLIYNTYRAFGELR